MTHDEFMKTMHEVEQKENELCKRIHADAKELCGNDKMIVFDRRINVDFGKYGSFDAIAVCDGVLMARCENAWCDKPIQPYYANVWRFGWIQSHIEKGRYHIEDNPLLGKKYTICV